MIPAWGILAIISSLSFAVSNVLTRLSHLKHGNYWDVYLVSTVINFSIILPVALLDGFTLSEKIIGVAIAYGTLFFLVSTILFSYSIKVAGSVITTVGTLAVEPFTTTALSNLIVGERIDWKLILSSATMIIVSYLIYTGSRRENIRTRLALIGFIVGLWFSLGAVFYSFSVMKLAIKPIPFLTIAFIPRLLLSVGMVFFRGSPSILFRAPRELYLSAIFEGVGVLTKFASLSYGLPAKAMILILLDVPTTLIISYLVKGTNEVINKNTVLATLLSFASAGIILS